MTCMKTDNNPVVKPFFQFSGRSNSWENETEMHCHKSVIIKELQEGTLKLQGKKFPSRFLIKAENYD